jgi:hypothetical protein
MMVLDYRDIMTDNVRCGALAWRSRTSTRTQSDCMHIAWVVAVGPAACWTPRSLRLGSGQGLVKETATFGAGSIGAIDVDACHAHLICLSFDGAQGVPRPGPGRIRLRSYGKLRRNLLLLHLHTPAPLLYISPCTRCALGSDLWSYADPFSMIYWGNTPIIHIQVAEIQYTKRYTHPPLVSPRG